MAGEFDFIEWVRSRTPAAGRVLVGPGDDCAVLAPGTRPQLVTTDVLTEGVDFLVAEVGPRRVGRKAMNVNLSDVAAMAGVPIAAVVGVVLPRGAGPEFARELYLGLRDAADAFGVPIIGGDTNSWGGELVVSVTLLGEATARGPVLRSGAKPGDGVYVTGPCGGSILGRHLDFAPRITEALALHAATPLHAMADVSDGLAADLNHILEESRCGAVLFAERIPITEAAHALARTSGKSPLAHALADGEDFELVFTAASSNEARLLAGDLPAIRIGECVTAGFWLEADGVRRQLPPGGWVHAW